MKASLPINEQARLDRLRRLNLLDTLPEETFDGYTALAAYICQTPVALISLVDKDRQWFKSRTGWELRETHRDIAFCAHAILKPDEMLVVEDALSDERFVDNTAVTSDPHIRFYAGSPLVTSDGFALGTLCVLDYQPRHLNEEQLSALHDLSKLVMSRIELTRQQEAQMNDLARFVTENPNPILRLDLDGDVLYTNDPGAEILGADSGQSNYQVPPEWLTAIDQIRHTNDSVTVESSHAGRVYLCHFVPILERGYVNLYCNDISDRKQREIAYQEQQELLEQVQHIGHIGSWKWEPATDDLICSDEVYAIHDMNREKQHLKLKEIIQLVHPEDRDRLGQLHNYFAEGSDIAPIEYRIVTPKGTLKHLVMQGSLLPNQTGQSSHIFGTVQDITERKQAENDRLARKAAEQASTAKSEFLSRMSHELRTPMNSILGFAQLLEMSRNESLTATQHNRVEQILKAGQHLLELINEVLEISRIEAGRLDISLEAVAVAQVVSEVLDLTVPLADERQIRVRREIDPEQETYVKADQQRFKQVMINLLSNAIKYNSEGGEVRLTCESRPDGWQRISIHDTGPGIALADQARLFQPFERLGGAQQAEVTGTGLGLALSKRLVELMGGQIGVESAIGKGSTFWIELPAATPQLNGEVSQSDDRPRPEIRGEGHTILYIEDNLTNFDLVEQVLADESQVSLIWAIQGSVGLDLARQHLPDLILLDLHLPDMHGSEVLAQLRQDEATAAIPVIVISADATPRQIERLMAGGAEAYLTKPLNVPEFLHTVQMLLTRS